MGKAIKRIWRNLANLPRFHRAIIKIIIFLIVLLFVLFPNPALVIDQIAAYLNTEVLFDYDFPEMTIINNQIDSLLPENYSFQEEYKTIVRFVYKNVHYKFDWDNWLNCEYWPTASQVWRRGHEDCDGQAILAVAIFRARGYRNADIVGSMQHLWIRVNGKELMGPDTEKLVVVEKGKKQFRLPSWYHMVETSAGQINYFPKFRIIIILLTLLGLLYHPAYGIKRLLWLVLTTLIGFSLLSDWAHNVEFYRRLTFGLDLIVGFVLILGSLIIAAISKHSGTSSQ